MTAILVAMALWNMLLTTAICFLWWKGGKVKGDMRAPKTPPRPESEEHPLKLPDDDWKIVMEKPDPKERMIIV